MDVLKRASKASLIWLLYWPFACWQIMAMSVSVFQAAYRTDSVNPRDWDTGFIKRPRGN